MPRAAILVRPLRVRARIAETGTDSQSKATPSSSSSAKVGRSARYAFGFLKSMHTVGVAATIELGSASLARPLNVLLRFEVSIRNVGRWTRLPPNSQRTRRQMFAPEEQFAGDDETRHAEDAGVKDLLLSSRRAVRGRRRCDSRRSPSVSAPLAASTDSMTRGSSISSSRFQNGS